MFWAASVFTLVALCAPAQQILGTWKASLAEPPATLDNWPSGMDAEVPTTLTLILRKKKIAGTVQIDSWPGNAKITDVKIEGDHFSLTLLTENSSPDGPQTLYCDGTTHADLIEFTLRWPQRKLNLKMKGKRAT